MRKFLITTASITLGLIGLLALAVVGISYKNYLAERDTYIKNQSANPSNMLATLESSSDCKHWMGAKASYIEYLLSFDKPKSDQYDFYRMTNQDTQNNTIPLSGTIMASKNLPYDVFNADLHIHDTNQIIQINSESNTLSIDPIKQKTPGLTNQNFASRLAITNENLANTGYILLTDEDAIATIAMSGMGTGEIILLKCRAKTKKCFSISSNKNKNVKIPYQKEGIIGQIHTLCSRLQSDDIRAIINDYQTATPTCNTPDERQKILNNYQSVPEKCAAFDRDIVPLLDTFFATQK